MAAEHGDAPRVAPGPLKGSGSKAPWIVLAVLVVALLAIGVSILLALIVLRS
jgi:hypothetical protein